ncbi:hypothetical protein [Stappia indica]|uniref:hypothetical protein n=1 Tax=Stappia indica TaxID=538381 RepID=UPI001CD59777|nr:hypothetical protein [Stappia indica]MCA1298032.1 hypothetical protein [Stappia indica]
MSDIEQDNQDYSPEELAALGEAAPDDGAPTMEDPAPEPEASAGDDTGTDGGDDGDKPAEPDGADKRVPLAALHEERRRRQERDAKIAELEQRVTILQTVEDRFAQFAKQGTLPQPEEQPAPPDPSEDPLAYIDHLGRQVSALSEQQQQSAAARQAEEQRRNFLGIVQTEEAQFKQQAPDYEDAAAFVRNAIAQEMEIMGVPPQMQQQAVGNQLLNIAISAKESGRTVPEVVYQMAKMRGYAKAEASAADAETAAAKEALDRIDKGQRDNRDVTPGGAGSGAMTLEKFAAMSEAESFAWLEKNPKAAERLLGA